MTSPPQPQLVTVANGVHAWIGAGGDSNAGAIETPDGLLIVDTQQYPRLARAFRDALEAKVGSPVRAVINTHCHLDHTSGNSVFSGVPIIAHRKTLDAMNENLGARTGDRWSISDFETKIRFLFGQNVLELVPADDPARRWFEGRIALPDYDTVEVVAPTETFADEFAWHLPRETVRLRYFGPAHCDGDIVVHLVRAKTVFLGDLLFHGRFPWLGDCDLGGWIDALGRVLALDVDVVVPGHGVPTTLKEVARFRDMLSALREGVARALRAGASEDAAVAEVQLPQYTQVQRYKEWMPINVRAAYRYLKARM